MKKNNDGFFMVLVILMTLVLWLFALIVWNMHNIDTYFLDNQLQQEQIKNHQKNQENIVWKFSTLTNSDGLWEDILSCSGWLIQFDTPPLPAICEWWEWINTPDGIDDSGNNDDFTASFYDGNISSLVTSNSQVEDNDDFARRYAVGILWPGEKKTIWVFNDTLTQLISFNLNNQSNAPNTPKLLWDTTRFSVKIDLSHISSKVRVLRFDKNIFLQNKEIQIISDVESPVSSLSGNLLIDGNIWESGTPYIFDRENFDYAILLENTSENEVLTYSYEWVDEWQNPLYIVWLDDNNGFEKRKYYFPQIVETYYWWSFIE